MRSARARSIPPLICLLLVAQSLWPVASFDRVLELLCLPARLMGELAAPLAWAEPDRVFASAEDRAALAAARLARLEQLDEALRQSAHPSSVTLERQVRSVHADVVGRESRQRDRIRLRVEDASGLVIGLPVVYGDGFVGLISALPGSISGVDGKELAEDELICDLITGREARIIGSWTAAMPSRDERIESGRLVVGGLAPLEDEVLLDIHSPTWSRPGRGTVVVAENRDSGEGFAHLANGFYFGELVASYSEEGGPEPTWSIRPLLDYAAGLHQVLILAPGIDEGPIEREPVDPQASGSWRATRRLLDGNPSPGRDCARIPLGELAGVTVGTALASERVLVGRVARVGPLSALVRGLGDPGLSLSAVAMVRTADGERPHVLGMLSSRGRLPDGRLVFEWPATVPLEHDAAHPTAGSPAEIWTGSGEPGVPLGLSIGTTHLPHGPGPHALVVEPPKIDEQALRVRLPDRAVLEGLEGGGE